MEGRPVLLVTRKLPDAVEARLARSYDARLNAPDRLYEPAALPRLAEGAAALLVCPTDAVSAGVIAELPGSVRIIATFSVGTDHIDLEAARRRGIVVTNTPDVLSDATADIAMLLLLAAARRAGEGERLMRAGERWAWSPTFMLGAHVTGKTVGIVGMGRVGRAFARRARGFDMAVRYHNRRRLPPESEAGAIYHDSVESLLPHCDFVSLHCPATPESRHLIDVRRIALMKDGAIVINTARGSVVDDGALIGALGTGKLAAAGLDVFNGEPNDIHPDYRALPNVFLLPHLGSATVETRNAMGFRALDNLDAFFAGKEPRDRVA